jgi:hypothetical protein
MNNPTLSTIYITIDLTNCKNVVIEGYDDEVKITEWIEPMTEGTLFTIQKNPPFLFNIGFSAREEPMPVDKQLVHLAPKIAKTDLMIDRMKEELNRIPFEVMSVPQIVEALNEAGYDHFVDPTFPPNETSIFDVTNEPSYPLDSVAVWKRPHEFMQGHPKLYDESIDPNDISQGALGNCWFLAAMASLAENPALVKRLFITDEYNEFGIYQLRICKNGEWVVVTVDDYIPCTLKGGPMFSINRGNELWVCLLEKAYAKLHGNYWQLRAGYVSHGMMDLSGCPTFRFSFPQERNNYSDIAQYADRLWDILIKADKYGHIMWAGTPGVDEWTEGGGPTQKTGIVPGHAYSVIQVKQYYEIRLLNIRNPWGQFEWGGEWWDNHRNWTKEMIDAFQPHFDDEDGSFWMSYEDFLKNFESITVWKIQNWDELRLKGKFIKVEEAETNNDWVISQFYYTFSLSRKTHIEMGLHQEDERILGADARRYLDASFVILKKQTNGEFSVAGMADLNATRDVEKEFNLEAGNYIVVPFTTGALLRSFQEFDNPVHFKTSFNGKKLWNFKLYSVFSDIFRKTDLQLDGILTARELNLFGNIVGDSFFSNITQETFLDPEFDNVSHVTEGITKHGFYQLLSTYSDAKIQNILNKMGYDESLQSYKSRVFVMTFHSTEKLKVRIKSAAHTDLNEKASNLILADHLAKTNYKKAREDENVVIFRMYHDHAYANSFAAVNKTSDPVEINFDMTASENCVFMPSSGRCTHIIPPNTLKYIASCIVGPTATNFRTGYVFETKRM